MSEHPGKFRRGFNGLMKFITWLRLVLVNLFFLLIIVVLIAVIANKPIPTIPEQGALILNLQGTVVDQLSYTDPLSQLLGQNDPQQQEVLLSDVVEAIELASEDERITALVLRLDDLLAGGLSKMQEISQALTGFRASGKKIIAYGDLYTQQQYWLAAQADEVYMHPMGGVLLEGFGLYRNYFQRTLDKLKVNFHVFRVGGFKSAMEPFTRDDMSAEAKLANQTWLNSLWSQYVEAVAQRRQLKPSAINDYINNIADLLADYGGNTASVAVAAGLVDGLKNRDEINRYLIDVVGREDKDGYYEGVGFKRYLWLRRLEPTATTADAKVAVIVAAGNIVDGEQPPGMIGGDTLAGLIRQARRDATVRAVVLRIDSGGGSAFASEIIRRELELLRQEGKPLVVSMGSLAASGGYWIAAQADEIWATPTTLTGSIGIYGAFPTLENSLDALGVSTDGVGTTALAGALRVDRPLSPLVKQSIQSTIEHGYRQFIEIVANGRDMPREQVEEIAQGRVWSGIDALRLGLVDRLGGLPDAIAAAAAKAELDTYELEYIEIPLSPQEQLLRELLGQAATRGWVVAPQRLRSWLLDMDTALSQSLQSYAASLTFVSQMNDPKGAYLFCSSCIAL